MPLPFRDKVKLRSTEREYDRDFSEETAGQEELELGQEADYLGSGVFNIVYHSGDVVTKYTKYEDEAEIYRKQFEQNYPCLIKVLEAPVKIQERRVLPSYTGSQLWRIRMEKATPLTDRNKNLAVWCCNSTRHMLDERIERITGSGIVQDVVQNINEAHGPVNEFDYGFLGQYGQLVEELVSFGFSPEEAHADNIGYNKEGKLVLFDLGQSM